jgi:hypothetical protein
VSEDLFSSDAAGRQGIVAKESDDAGHVVDTRAPVAFLQLTIVNSLQPIIFATSIRRFGVARVLGTLLTGQLKKPRKALRRADKRVSKAGLHDIAWHGLKRLKELIRVVPVLMGIVFNTRPSLKPPVSLVTQLFNLQLK